VAEENSVTDGLAATAGGTAYHEAVVAAHTSVTR
jgi:hypothetical protein